MHSRDSQPHIQPRKGSSPFSGSSSTSSLGNPSTDDPDHTLTPQTTLRQTASHGTGTDSGLSNYRQVLAQVQDEDLSPSSSHSSLASYFKRTNSTSTEPGLLPGNPNSSANSVSNASFASISSNNSSTHHHHHHHHHIGLPSFIKNSVISRRKHRKPTEQSPHLSISYPLESSSTNQAPPAFNSRFIMPNADTTSIYSSSSGGSTNTPSGAPYTGDEVSIKSTANIPSTIADPSPRLQISTNISSTSEQPGGISAPDAGAMTSNSNTVMSANESARSFNPTYRNIILDDTPVSPKATIFSPRFLGQSQPSPLSTNFPPAPVRTQPSQPAQVKPTVTQSPAPLFFRSQPPQQPPKQPFLTIQDIQDVSPLSSFSYASNDSDSSAAPNNANSQIDPNFLFGSTSGPSSSNFDRNPTTMSDSRRPSYASQMTASSVGSTCKRYESADDISLCSSSPTNQSTNYISETNEDHSSHTTRSNSTAPTSFLTSTRSNSRVNPIVFPQPDEVFDTKEMQRFTELKSRAQNSPDSYSERSTRSSSRSESVDSSAQGKSKSKKSFLGKFISRRESSADFHDKAAKKGLKPKSSESNIKFGGSSSKSGFEHHSLRPNVSLFSTGRDALQYVASSTLDRDPSQHSGSRLRSSSASRHFKRPGNNDSTVTILARTKKGQQDDASIPQSPMGTVASSSTFYTLDTDLEHMGGIVDGKKTHSAANSISGPIRSASTLNHITDSLSSEVSSQGGPSTLVSFVNPSLTGPSVPSDSAGWQAPESWNIVPEAPSLSPWPSARETSPSQDTTKVVKKAARHCVRIFREDGTFGTISCDLDVTVTELIQLLGKKFFLSVSGYQLTVRVGGLKRILLPKERPLVYQKKLLEFMGYTEDDRLGEVGREDLSYLCRFEFGKLDMRMFTETEKANMSRNFVEADMHDMDLQTIPVLFYSHCFEIERLDVSENPSITIPSDFIQACVNLQSIRYVRNKAIQFPLNILQTRNLRELDLSNNLISHLENIDFSRLSSLIKLDLHGNKLSSIHESINKLSSLQYLNLSSNDLTEVFPAICDITSLRQLDISFNKISSLPDEIGQLVNLEEFAITNNYLTKKLPDTFPQLKNLKDLDLRYNKLQSIDILSQLPLLEVLYCSKNSVSSFTAEFPKLKLFYFDRNPITKIELLPTHSTLTVLNLSKAKIAALHETFLEKIPFVEKLVLDKNHMSSLPPHIGSLKSLIYLSIVANNLHSVPPEIGLLHELRHLDLHNNNIRALPEEIWNLAFLEYLNASSNLLESFPKHIVQSSISSSESERFKSFGDLIHNYEIGSTARRPSTLSIASTLGPNDRRMSAFPPTNGRYPSVAFARDPPGGLRQRRTLAQCLLTLSLSDNRLTDECFEEISWLTELQVLNLSYNELIDIPFGALRRFHRLSELYLSGNHLTSLPADDLESIQTLRVFHVNSNKLHSLPAELGKISTLSCLDVGSNNLKYNINNWPYDWNWNYNQNLRYLNFSGNRRLEVKAQHNQASHFGRESNEKDLSDFTVLNKVRVLGLMDVTLITPSVPDQTENCRVRTYGSEINSMPYGMADSIGHNINLSVIDMVLERFRGKDNEVVIGLFDGRCEGKVNGNKVSKLIQETFGSIFTNELKKLRENETVQDALRRAFLNTNKEIGNTALMPTEEIAHSSIGHRSSTALNLESSDGMTGSCATIVYIVHSKLYVANAGDSMAILSRASGEYTVLTTRHDPTSQAELARIRAAAGVVSSTGQLDDMLDVSRAIGFYNLIPHIHATPSITEYDLGDNDEILIIGSKQLWEYVSYQIALDVVRMSEGDLMRAAAKLRDFAIAYGASDKIMVMVIGVGISRRRSKCRTTGTTFGPMTSIGEEELFPAFKKRRDRNLLPEDSRLARLGGEVDPPVNELAMIFTDIKNSTLLWETSPIAMRSAIKIHNSIMRRQLRIIGGYEVKTEGDAFMVSFPTVTSALLWCFSVQSLLLVADWPAEIVESAEGCEVLDDKDEVIFRGLSVRMGIHWGSPVCERDPITRRMDYFGPMVNRASRVSAVADGGQIALSFDFVAEMRRLEDAVNKFTSGEVETISDAFGGDESLGLAIQHDLKMLNNQGWILKELGEEKLKGLENPEFISLAYQKTLFGRYSIHQERLNLKRAPPQTAASSKLRPLHMDLMLQLRHLAMRLENVCSKLNNRATSGGSVKSEVGQRMSLLAGLASSLPSTEADYAVFMGHIMTRIENSLSTLYLRTSVFNLYNNGHNNLGIDGGLTGLSDILGALLHLGIGPDGNLMNKNQATVTAPVQLATSTDSNASTIADDPVI